MSKRDSTKQPASKAAPRVLEQPPAAGATSTPLPGQSPLFETPGPESVRERWRWCRVVTDGQALNLRKGPGMDQEIVWGLLPGEWLEVLEESSFGLWWRVSTVDRQVGWIKAEFCKEVER